MKKAKPSKKSLKSTIEKRSSESEKIAAAEYLRRYFLFFTELHFFLEHLRDDLQTLFPQEILIIRFPGLHEPQATICYRKGEYYWDIFEIPDLRFLYEAGHDLVSGCIYEERAVDVACYRLRNYATSQEAEWELIDGGKCIGACMEEIDRIRDRPHDHQSLEEIAAEYEPLRAHNPEKKIIASSALERQKQA